MKPFTILIATDTFLPTVNGASRFTSRLSEGLASRGYNVHIICPDAIGVGRQSYKAKKNITIHNLTSFPSFLYGDFRITIPIVIRQQIKEIFTQFQPNIVHIQCHYAIGRTAAQEALDNNIKLIGTNHFMPENVLTHIPIPSLALKFANKLSWKDCGNVFNKCNIVTAPTPRAAKFLEEKGNVKNVLSISCGIDTSYYDKKSGEIIYKHPYKEILFVGRLDSEKNLHILIKAMQLIPSTYNAKLTIVGTGVEEKKLKNLVFLLKIADKVNFLGHIPDTLLRKIYIRSYLFCMPGTAELQSLATLESMCAGKPVVAANAMALPHLVKNGKNGYLFKPNDPKDLSEKIIIILRASQKEYTKMSKFSKNMTYKHSLNATLDKFENIYHIENKL